ncbi:hypothetical protein HS088_TW09G01360 [Tripterygium wilfordii]|uniref:Uncharacterized protein n=1 Tax=Tripterygium wilfordii TaxID=458696 RepID=A0A7J7DAH5_TRIWF|nr:hypothetical protein HS088_TW09G01360 [Tripterygium wilfordii]
MRTKRIREKKSNREKVRVHGREGGGDRSSRDHDASLMHLVLKLVTTLQESESVGGCFPGNTYLGADSRPLQAAAATRVELEPIIGRIYPLLGWTALYLVGLSWARFAKTSGQNFFPRPVKKQNHM